MRCSAPALVPLARRAPAAAGVATGAVALLAAPPPPRCAGRAANATRSFSKAPSTLLTTWFFTKAEAPCCTGSRHNGHAASMTLWVER